jgi:hypothetical protein
MDVSPESTPRHEFCTSAFICTKPARQAVEHCPAREKSEFAHPGMTVVYAALQEAGRSVVLGEKSDSATASENAAPARTTRTDEKAI